MHRQLQKRCGGAYGIVLLGDGALTASGPISAYTPWIDTRKHTPWIGDPATNTLSRRRIWGRSVRMGRRLRGGDCSCETGGHNQHYAGWVGEVGGRRTRDKPWVIEEQAANWLGTHSNVCHPFFSKVKKSCHRGVRWTKRRGIKIWGCVTVGKEGPLTGGRVFKKGLGQT